MLDLLDKIKLEEEYKDELRSAKLTSVVYDKTQKVIKIEIQCSKTIGYQSYIHLIKAIENYILTEVIITIDTQNCDLDFSNLSMYIEHCVQKESLKAMLDVTMQINGDIKLLCLNEAHKIEVEK